MRTVEQTMEIVFATLRDASPPLGMNQRIMKRVSDWRSMRCRPPGGDQIRKFEPISPRVRKPWAKR
jgi:hypothetical protein